LLTSARLRFTGAVFIQPCVYLIGFTFNMKTFQRIKLNHRVTFPQQLDVSALLDDKVVYDVHDPTAEKQRELKRPVRYELFSILMHSGSAHGGHYFLYAKALHDQQW
jgi:ubiquitin carboxyl-terminal hydrolase 47